MIPAILRQLVTTTLTVGAAVVILRQCRKPAWLPGRLFLMNMNSRHAGLTQWGLSQIALRDDLTALDVGCGGGRTVDRLASVATHGRVFGIDYSAQSAATSRRTNAKWIDAGRAGIAQASVSNLPFPAATFDLVTAVETHYYWPNIGDDVKEILRVVKPGGQALIIAETYKGRSADWMYRPAMALLGATYLTADEHRTLLETAGFTGVRVLEDRAHGWICAVGTKAAPTPAVRVL